MISAALETSLIRAQTNTGGLRSRVLRVPLLGKLIVANAFLSLAALLVHEMFPAMPSAAKVSAVLIVSSVVSGLLARLALRPIAQLEATAARVSRGDFSARVPESPLADRNIRALSVTMNHLLDHVETDRARTQYLAGRAVRALDLERETLARELRESLAQTATAIGMQVTAAQRSGGDSAVEHLLEPTRAMIEQLTEEMRTVAETLYPGTLSKFGLINALEALGHRSNRDGKFRVQVHAGLFEANRLSAATASALYRVADEALRNVARHADANNVRITLRTNGDVRLSIEDDGRGMQISLDDPMQVGLGLFSARAVLALVGGELQISSAPGLGTRVAARIPLQAYSNQQ